MLSFGSLSPFPVPSIFARGRPAHRFDRAVRPPFLVFALAALQVRGKPIVHNPSFDLEAIFVDGSHRHSSCQRELRRSSISLHPTFRVNHHTPHVMLNGRIAALLPERTCAAKAPVKDHIQRSRCLCPGFPIIPAWPPSAPVLLALPLPFKEGLTASLEARRDERALNSVGGRWMFGLGNPRHVPPLGMSSAHGRKLARPQLKTTGGAFP